MPYSKHATVAVFTTRHWLDLRDFTPALIVDNLAASLEYIRAVTKVDADARFCAYNINYLYPSGGCQGRSKTRPVGRSKTRPVGRSKSRPEERVEDRGIVGEEGVWSEGLRRLQGGAFRPERKTSSSPRRVRRSG